ncbi:MAG: hypothetical protein MRT15_04710 [archaeon YNP-LCB-003-016]|jgi:hypothetical protein|uniref:hypothetical protein n=1 Tax=Candidatus Culexarchaeum yellowstonense TaxID=2928963 RepID=UPI0026ED2268|nr:hypothetical protein [Candidatus Culexarchaeum yellowstonense]MCR6691666.1 hypothetical protein [Candidatus Culexarchaeum yellowstonense]
MKTLNRIWDLALIMVAVWVMMIALIVMIDKMVVPLKILVDGGATQTILEALIKLMISAFMAMSWLLIWVKMIQKYIERYNRI